jgi:starvation-inducible outer membrane lipoprotein
LTRTALTLSALALMFALALSGCTGSPATLDGPSPVPEASSAPAATSEISTAAQALVGGSVTAATETEHGRVQLDTTIVDPRGENGSPEALEALALCVTHVSVMEEDGTSFVLAGHPSYGEGCVEV